MNQKIEAIGQALLKQFQRDEPLMDTASIKEEFLLWLSAWPHPSGDDADTWEQSLQICDVDPADQEADKGSRLRMTLRLSTAGNRYLIAVTECLDPAGRGNYVLTAHANWKEDQRQLQETLDMSYQGEFIDNLRAHHTVWAQTFRAGELAPALNVASAAILGRELTTQAKPRSRGTPVDRPPSAPLTLPDGEQ
ncbi:MAG: hypothetical protein ABIE70_11125 [bacterium]